MKTKNKKIILLFSVLWVWAISSVPTSSAQDHPLLQSLESLQRQIKPFSYLPSSEEEEGENATEEATPQCADLTDNFCHQLYAPPQEGNWQRGNSQFWLGKSEKSKITKISLINLQALLSAEKRLPIILQESLGPLLAELRSHLEREEDSRQWYRQLDDNLRRINYAVEDAAKEITHQQYPQLKGKSLGDLTTQERSIYTQNNQDLDNAIVEAKYQHSPNWQRVLRLAQQAKKHLIFQVKKLNLPPAYQQKMIERLTAVEIMLPYEDPRLLTNQEPNCSTTQINALYVRPYNRFTVCAGMFNGMQSEGQLYATIAHELAHSIDPSSMAEELSKDHPTFNIAHQLGKSSGKTFSCEQWEHLKTTALQKPATINAQVLPTSALQSCLVDKSELTPWNDQNINSALDFFVNKNFAPWASSLDFTRLATFTINNKGASHYNEFYLRPDLLKLKDDAHFPLNIQLLPPLGGIFVQALLCQQQGNNFFRPQQMPREQREKIFAAALAETKEIYTAILAVKLSFCGDECAGLVSFNLAKQSHENFADFLAYRSVGSFLAERPQLAIRRQIVEEMGTIFCVAPGIEKESPALAAIESSYSKKAHGDNRQRRLAMFSPEIIQQIRCLPSPAILQTHGNCKI